MANKKTTYVAKPVDAQGYAEYSKEEDSVWHDLLIRQTPIVQDHACEEYLQGLQLLNLPKDRVPQLPEVSKVLQKATGWSLAPVPAIIPVDYFFGLLANRQFPAATFIRLREEIDYIEEPDLFHELFGHCPLLTNQAYADFTHLYGKLCLNASHAEREMLGRLYWFTIEFGLIETARGLRVYGGGILSSKNETIYALESKTAVRKRFDPLEALRTPYRIDIMQPIYYVIDNFSVLFELIEMDLSELIKKANALGMHKPLYSTEDEPSV